MPRITAQSTCPVYDSFRVQQVAGMFDVPLANRCTANVAADFPAVDEAWQIGLVVGPSASGKSTLARQVFGDALYAARDWPRERAVVDCLGELPIKQITGLFTTVGFSSPPSWIKPYHALSTGEQFRCDLARALAEGMARGYGAIAPPSDSAVAPPSAAFPIVAFDEFTSVVDRQSARIGAAALGTSLRGGRLPCRFVAITCHYDVAEWLAPDWIVDLADGACQWRNLRRPGIPLRLFRCHRRAWTAFARHHYLSSALAETSRCFLAMWDETPVAFCATLPIIGRRMHWRISRIVVLPDFQGVGIGLAVVEAVAELHRQQGHRMNITASHPSVIAHCARSPRWRFVRMQKAGARRGAAFIPNYRGSAGRAVVSFEFTSEESAVGSL